MSLWLRTDYSNFSASVSTSWHFRSYHLNIWWLLCPFDFAQIIPHSVLQQALHLGKGCPRKTTRIILYKMFGKEHLATHTSQRTSTEEEKEALDKDITRAIKSKYNSSYSSTHHIFFSFHKINIVLIVILHKVREGPFTALKGRSVFPNIILLH